MEIPGTNKVAAIIILYYPKENVVENILSYSSYCNRLYIFDNTPAKSETSNKLKEIPNCVILQDEQNRGIPERLNAGCQLALQDGHEWALTMDQDTCFRPDDIVHYFTCFNQYQKKAEVAAFCTRYSRDVVTANAQCIAEVSDDVITSGMLVSLWHWRKLGGFDEALFIDAVDHEYVARTEVAGYKIVCFANVYIQHQKGELVYRSSIKSLFLIKKEKIVHSPLRCYYIYRNMLYLENKYQRSHPSFVKQLRKNVETHISTCKLYGRETKLLNRYIALAKSDYESGKMGRIEDEKIIS